MGLSRRPAEPDRQHVGRGDRSLDRGDRPGRKPEMINERTTLRIAAVADIHVKKTSQGAFQNLFASATEAADVMLLCGDLTDYGSVEEAKVLAKEITTSLRIPAIGVLGNHDYESDSEAEIVRILTDAGVTMLDGDSYELHGVGFAGVKGFGGGFGRRA